MSATHCCPKCFDDRGLLDSIISALEPIQGTCSYCGTTDTSLVEPSALSYYFELLADVYQPDPNGKTLVDWLMEDWLLFTHERMDVLRAEELLREILNDDEVVRQSLSPASIYESEGLVQWDALRDEMMYRNRWFLDEILDRDRLGELLNHLPAKDLRQRWFRARIQTGDEEFTIDKMGAPPKRIASNGRANPAGIPYLYLASDPNTAVAEIRPHMGDRVYVAEFEIPEIRAVDLRNPRKLVSPFIPEVEDGVGKLRAGLPLLERLGEELTRPVLPHSAAIDYIPTQYFCEFIKNSGFDGVVYGSSVGEGFNLALFDTQKGSGKNVTRYTVSKVSVEVTQTELT